MCIDPRLIDNSKPHKKKLQLFLVIDYRNYLAEISGGSGKEIVDTALDWIEKKYANLSICFAWQTFEYFPELKTLISNYYTEKHNGYMSTRGSEI